MKSMGRLRRTTTERRYARRLAAAGLDLTDDVIRRARELNRLPIDVLDEAADFERTGDGRQPNELGAHPTGTGLPAAG